METLIPAQNPLVQERADTFDYNVSLLIAPCKNIAHTLEKLIQEFWGVHRNVKLFSVANEPHYYWHLQDFYVAQKGLDTEGKRWAQIRLSEGMCQNLFETTLGKNLDDPDFMLADLRNFEIFLLERFSRKLFQILSPTLLKRVGKNPPDIEHDPLIHTVWTLQGEREQVCQMVLSVPGSCLKTQFDTATPKTQLTLPDEAFYTASAAVALKVGATHARLEDIQTLEAGDLILLEDSQLNSWWLRATQETPWLPVQIKIPDSRKGPHLLETQGGPQMAETLQASGKTIWDNLEVEVTASFNPIKLPLKNLKEMEEGLVVEVGDLMDNRIQIEVEGHPVAWGELLVIGEKFGVRIEGLIEQTDTTTQKPQPLSSNQSNSSPLPTALAEEDADDLMDLNLDESDFDDLDDDDEDWS